MNLLEWITALGKAIYSLDYGFITEDIKEYRSIVRWDTWIWGLEQRGSDPCGSWGPACWHLGAFWLPRLEALWTLSFCFFFFARVQPQQDPGVPSGWMELARERERDGETKLRWSRSVTLFLKRAFIPWVVHRGEWKMQSHAGSAVLTLIETRLSFCMPFHIQKSYVIYIIFWPGGLSTVYDPFFLIKVCQPVNLFSLKVFFLKSGATLRKY